MPFVVGDVGERGRLGSGTVSRVPGPRGGWGPSEGVGALPRGQRAARQSRVWALAETRWPGAPFPGWPGPPRRPPRVSKARRTDPGDTAAGCRGGAVSEGEGGHPREMLERHPPQRPTQRARRKPAPEAVERSVLKSLPERCVRASALGTRGSVWPSPAPDGNSLGLEAEAASGRAGEGAGAASGRRLAQRDN